MKQEEFDEVFSLRKLNIYDFDGCKVITDVARSNGIVMTFRQAEMIWEDYSQSYCAGWLEIPESDDYKSTIWEIIVDYVNDHN